MLLFSGLSRADIATGVRIYNNQWQDTWLMTPAPEITFTGRWIALQADGTMGTFSPASSQDNYIIQSRFSVIPMLRAKFGPLETGIGYGFAYRFRREEIAAGSDRWAFSSVQETGGEFRFLAGFVFSLSDRLNLHLNGGYHYLTDEAMAYSAGISLGFKRMTVVTRAAEPEMDDGSDPVQTVESLAEKPEPDRPDEKPTEESASTAIYKPKPQAAPQIQTVCFIGTEDRFINEINASLGAALIQKGIHVLNWDMLKTAVLKDIEAKADQEVSPNRSQASRNDFLMDDQQILINASSLFPLNAAIETKLRYVYETYGGAVMVNAAYVNMLDPQTGHALFTIAYEKPESTLTECKTVLTEQLVRKMTPMN